MEIREFENLIKTEFSAVIINILDDNKTLPIDVKQGERVGDSISKFLESKFVEYTKDHKYFKNSKPSPTGKTKNPWDVETTFEIDNHKELIWVDFKAVNTDNDNSNPDSGTPNKVFELMLKYDSFYLIYLVVFYKGLGPGKGLEFDNKDGVRVKPIFLKDVEKSMHITPPNQIQFNVFEPDVYRTRDEFIAFFKEKIIASNQRRIDDAQEKLDLIKKGKFTVPKTIYEKQEFDFSDLDKINSVQEEKIKLIKKS